MNYQEMTSEELLNVMSNNKQEFYLATPLQLKYCITDAKMEVLSYQTMYVQYMNINWEKTMLVHRYTR